MQVAFGVAFRKMQKAQVVHHQALRRAAFAAHGVDAGDAALAIGLVDVKVCAVDEKWSGLKLVIRKENRL